MLSLSILTISTGQVWASTLLPSEQESLHLQELRNMHKKIRYTKFSRNYQWISKPKCCFLQSSCYYAESPSCSKHNRMLKDNSSSLFTVRLAGQILLRWARTLLPRGLSQLSKINSVVSSGSRSLMISDDGPHITSHQQVSANLGHS